MIIDAHAHIWDKGWVPDWYEVQREVAYAKRWGVSLEEAAKRRDQGFDKTGDLFVRNMDAAGVDLTMIGCVDWLVDYRGGVKVSIEEINEAHAEAVQLHPGRLIWAVGVDPRRPNAKEIVKRGVELGAKALKLHPSMGWHINDRIAYPLYQLCVDASIPVDIHTGCTGHALRSKFAHPLLLDDISADFPDLTIKAIHTGYDLWREAVAVARKRLNIYLDTAGWQVFLKSGGGSRHGLVRFYEMVRFVMDAVGPRFMFASDRAPQLDPTDQVEWVKAFTQIPSAVREAGIDFTEDELADFLGRTAQRVFKI